MTDSMKFAKLDFFTMKSQLPGYLSLVFVVTLFSVMGSDIITICITSAWFTALMSFNVFIIQEKNNLNRLYGSVSISLRNIVLGRYLYVILSYLMCLLLSLILYIPVSYINNILFVKMDFFIGTSLSLLIFTTIVGLQMPILFKLGYTKGRLWSAIPFIVIMLLIPLPSFVSSLSNIITFILSHTSLLITICLVASGIIYYLSYQISVLIYRR
ncbi:MAG: ABC-2 transporter permease [Mobilitalea sp.]